MKLLLICIVIVLLFNAIDILASNRHIFSQFRLGTFVTSPLNSLVYLGTPLWLKRRISKSPILVPTLKIFPNLQRLRDAFPILEKEAQNALENSKPIKHDLFFRNLADDGWKRFYIKWYGPPDPLALKVCPQTVKLLESMPEVHLGMFSILMPGSKIPLHHGPARMCLRYHLGILTPEHEDCNIQIGGHKYIWKNGEDVIFDDTFFHEVVNNTNKPRIILFLDIERPQVPFFKPIAQAMIKYGGPATTRANEKQEKVIH
jgi:beta-hydroxylase